MVDIVRMRMTIGGCHLTVGKAWPTLSPNSRSEKAQNGVSFKNPHPSHLLLKILDKILI